MSPKVQDVVSLLKIALSGPTPSRRNRSVSHLFKAVFGEGLNKWREKRGGGLDRDSKTGVRCSGNLMLFIPGE